MNEIKENNTICPVTFINDKIETNKDINGLFLNPYNSKMHCDQYTSAMIKEIKKQDVDNNKLYKNWRYNVNYANNRANEVSIKTYTVTNISDLVRNTLIKFIEDVFYSRDMIGKVKNIETGSILSQSETVGTFFGGNFASNINIEEEVKNSITCANIFLHFDEKTTAQMIYVIMDMKMSALYSILVANVFDRFIVEHINVALSNQSLDQLFNFLYYKCYREDPKEIPNAQFEYSFCASIMREIMEKNLVNFRVALVSIAKNISLMIYNANCSAKENDILVSNKDYDDEFVEF